MYVLILIYHIYGYNTSNTIIQYVEYQECVNAGERLKNELKNKLTDVDYICFKKLP